MKIEVTVWVCPRCGNYFGSTSTGNLRKFWNRDHKGKKTHRRSECPNCIGVTRQPRTFTLEIPGNK